MPGGAWNRGTRALSHSDSSSANAVARIVARAAWNCACHRTVGAGRTRETVHMSLNGIVFQPLSFSIANSGSFRHISTHSVEFQRIFLPSSFFLASRCVSRILLRFVAFFKTSSYFCSFHRHFISFCDFSQIPSCFDAVCFVLMLSVAFQLLRVPSNSHGFFSLSSLIDASRYVSLHFQPLCYVSMRLSLSKLFSYFNSFHGIQTFFYFVKYHFLSILFIISRHILLTFHCTYYDAFCIIFMRFISVFALK